MISVVLHAGPGLDDYTLHLANALSEVAHVGYSVDARQRERYGDALSSRVTPLLFNRPRRRELWGFREMARQARVVRQFKPDFFHLQGDGLWESVLLRMLDPLPMINTIHDPIKHLDQRNLLNNVLMRDALRRSRGWVVHSESQRSFLSTQYSLDKTRILVHPHGILDYYGPGAHRINRKKKILFFGVLRLNKGYDLLLRAFNACKGELPEWELVIAGAGAPVKAVEPVLHNLGAQLDFRNAFIVDAEVGELFSSAGLVVMPYRDGSQSGVLAIAAVFGCPVLATPVGSLPEIVEDRKHVYFVEAGSETALIQGLLDLARNADLRQKLGDQLGELGRTQWRWEDCARQTVDFYHRIQLADQL